MKSMLKRSVIQWVVICFSVVCSAGAFAEFPLSSDAKLLADSRLVFSGSQRDQPYRLVLGPIRKINNQWRAEPGRTVTGSIKRQTYELQRTISFRDAEALLRDALEHDDVRRLYHCEGMNCGSSNGWANEVFEIKQLYGLDTYQYYTVVQVQNPSQVQYQVMYLVQRGNRRLYLQQDIITTEVAGDSVMSPAALKQLLNDQGYAVLAGARGSENEYQLEQAEIQALAEVLAGDPNMRIRLVGHSYLAPDLDVQIKMSQGYAKSAKAALIKADITESRLTAHGVGSLAPAGGNGLDRLGVVVWSD